MFDLNTIIARVHININNIPLMLIISNKPHIDNKFAINNQQDQKLSENTEEANDFSHKIANKTQNISHESLNIYETVHDLLHIINKQLAVKFTYINLDFEQTIDHNRLIMLNNYIDNMTLHIAIDNANYTKIANLTSNISGLELEKYTSIKYNHAFKLQQTQIRIYNQPQIYTNLQRSIHLKISVKVAKTTIYIFISNNLINNILNSLLKTKIDYKNIFMGHKYYTLLNEYFLHNFITKHISPDSTITSIEPAYAKLKNMIEFSINTIDSKSNQKTLGSFYLSAKSLSPREQISKGKSQNIISKINLELLAGSATINLNQIQDIVPDSILLLDTFVTNEHLVNKVILNTKQQPIINITSNDSGEITLRKLMDTATPIE